MCVFFVLWQIIGSPVEEDECGICGGDGSKCKSRHRSFRRSSVKLGHSKLMILPAGARHILIRFKALTSNITLSIKERQTNQMVYQGQQWGASNRSTFVTEGAKFTRQNLNQTDLLHARGPILGPLVLLTSSDHIGDTFSANVSFTVSRLKDPLYSMQRYEWVIKGWSKCTKDCGGGYQKLILRWFKAKIYWRFDLWLLLCNSCVDKSSGRKIRKKFCGPRSSRPNGKRRRCNTFPCDFEWTTERWEECTHTCGSQGLQIRPVYCIPSNMNETQVCILFDNLKKVSFYYSENQQFQLWKLLA